MLKRLFPLMMVAFLACAFGPARASEAPTVAADPVLELRLNKLAEDLRCLVCQNQNLADSHAELAVDLKNQVREMLQKGMSDQEIIDYLVQRYGDFVLYKPPVKATTWLLWGGPFVLLVAALSVLLIKLRRRPVNTPLTAEEHAAAELLLKDEGKRS